MKPDICFIPVIKLFNFLRLRKFKRTAQVVLITLIISTTMHAQENFDSYVNKIFFNVFTGTPDSSIRKFLSDFVPVLLHRPENSDSGQWTVYPPGKIIRPTIIAHSIIFDKHPFIDADIKQGEFKVHTVVFNDSANLNATGINDIQVIMEFEKLDDATRVFEKFRNDLTTIGQNEMYYKDEHRTYYQIYSREEVNRVPGGVRIVLSTKHDGITSYQVSINFE